MKVSDILADYGCPPSNVSPDVAERVAGEIRRLVALEDVLDERDVATQIEIYAAEVDQEELHAAWWVLRDESRVRTSWAKYVRYEEWLRDERERVERLNARN